MESKLIDANELLRYIGARLGMVLTKTDVLRAVEMQPHADAVSVVRCKDCKYYQEGERLHPNKFCFRLLDREGNRVGYNFSDDDFCSRGVKKED